MLLPNFFQRSHFVGIIATDGVESGNIPDVRRAIFFANTALFELFIKIN